MAFSSSIKGRTVAGSLIMEVHSWDAASVTSGTVSTGISNILHVQVNNNVTADKPGLAVPSGQSVALSGVTANDTGTMLVVGY